MASATGADRRLTLKSLLVLLLLTVAGAFHAGAADLPPEFTSESERVRYDGLLKELRCLVCQNQTLADSDADLAQDLRDEVLRRIRAGESDREITDFMVQRYGDFVLYRPPVKAGTVLLWIGPFLLLAGGLIALVVTLRRRTARAATPLSEDERARVEALLRDNVPPPAA